MQMSNACVPAFLSPIISSLALARLRHCFSMSIFGTAFWAMAATGIKSAAAVARIAIDLVMCGLPLLRRGGFRLHLLARGLHGRDDVLVARAAAEVRRQHVEQILVAD